MKYFKSYNYEKKQTEIRVDRKIVAIFPNDYRSEVSRAYAAFCNGLRPADELYDSDHDRMLRPIPEKVA